MAEPWRDRCGKAAPSRWTRATGLVALMGLALLSGGCGNLTAGGARGETTVYVVGNGEDAAANAAATRLRSTGSSQIARTPVGTAAAAGEDEDDEPEGEMELHFFLSLVRPDGTTEPLTDDEAQINIDLPGQQEVEVLTRSVPAGRYAGFRISFTEIEVEIDAGLVIGGDPVTGAVDVDLDETTLIVERSIDLTLEDGERSEVVVDMNATDWLTAVDPGPPPVVDGDVVASLIEVVAR